MFSTTVPWQTEQKYKRKAQILTRTKPGEGYGKRGCAERGIHATCKRMGPGGKATSVHPFCTGAAGAWTAMTKLRSVRKQTETDCRTNAKSCKLGKQGCARLWTNASPVPPSPRSPSSQPGPPPTPPLIQTAEDAKPKNEQLSKPRASMGCNREAEAETLDLEHCWTPPRQDGSLMALVKCASTLSWRWQRLLKKC